MMDETLNIDEAAAFLHIHRATLIDIAGSGEIPDAAKIGRAWVFLKSGLIQYIKTQAAIQNKQRKMQKFTGTLPAANEESTQVQRKRGGPRKAPPPLPELPESIRRQG